MTPNIPPGLDTPAQGQMYMFDRLTPPLKDGSYRFSVSTEITLPTVPGDRSQHTSETHQLERDRYFNVEGPRFTLDPNEVANVYPPRNAHGTFHTALPQAVIRRVQLPWERILDPRGRMGDPSSDGLQPVPKDGFPWVALLLFEEGEYTLLRGVPLEQVLPSQIFQDLGSPSGISCDAIEAPLSVVSALMPSKEELALLAHVRWVNVEDRELNAAGGDGFYSVVMSNRVPEQGKKYRAALVSVEGRDDLISIEPPPEALFDGVVGLQVAAREHALAAPAVAAVQLAPTLAARGSQAELGLVYPTVLDDPPQRLVLLYSWQFTCDVGGTFQELMQELRKDLGLIGAVQQLGRPAVTDTGHIRVSLVDRSGDTADALYRGPLVAHELTRDPLGPYHSADQARRATDLGVEDISYAAAFELGRLLASADAKLAQALMRWRREAYKQSARKDVISAISQRFLPLLAQATTLTEQLQSPIVPQVAAAATARLLEANRPTIDPYGIDAARRTIGFDPAALRDVWQLGSTAEAAAILSGVGTELGAVVPAPAAAPAGVVSLDAVAQGAEGLAHLNAARDGLIATATKLAGGS
jgi:hypothetical protein